MPDQMRDDLGVGLGLELAAVRRKPFFQRQIIFDNAVMNDDDLARLVAVRMGILLGRPPVRRPTRVPDAVIPVERMQPNAFFKIPQLAFGPPKSKDDDRHRRPRSRRIIPAILELSQAVNDQRHNLFISNVSDNSTHNIAYNE